MSIIEFYEKYKNRLLTKNGILFTLIILASPSYFFFGLFDLCLYWRLIASAILLVMLFLLMLISKNKLPKCDCDIGVLFCRAFTYPRCR